MIYNKLVRDNIPSIIRNNNEIAITKELNESEFIKYLYLKLEEETKEVINSTSSKEVLEELADLLEVIKFISKCNNFSLEDVIKKGEEKNLKKGSFNKKILLIETK